MDQPNSKQLLEIALKAIWEQSEFHRFYFNE